MNTRKRTGSYYTPSKVAEFIVKHVFQKLKNKNSVDILEPSVGDGIFAKTIYNDKNYLKKIVSFDAIEKNAKEINKIKINESTFNKIISDFLFYQKNNSKRYDLVIGNPPYVKKNLLRKFQVDLCRQIHTESGLQESTVKNIWSAFVLSSTKFLKDDGVLAFVLPVELLQVNFASQIRGFLLKEFDRVEIFTFKELLFEDCKGQDTLILIAEKQTKEEKGVFFSDFNQASTLSQSSALIKSINLNESKWTQYRLSNDEILILEKLKPYFAPIDQYCDSKAGIVTAANNYFIVNEQTVKEYSLQKHVKSIIQKGVFVNGSVTLSKKDFNNLERENKPSYLIALNEDTTIRKNTSLYKYLKNGEKQDIHNRFKTSIRNKWFVVPNVGQPSEGFFFKRSHEYPKLIKNEAKVLATDSAYLITVKPDFKIESIIYSFYNSATLSFAELYGRNYGGGVLELTPNEFKILPTAYINVSSSDFKLFVKEFSSKNSIKDICVKNDYPILKSMDKRIDNDTIAKIFKIREKLYNHRIKA